MHQTTAVDPLAWGQALARAVRQLADAVEALRPAPGAPSPGGIVLAPQRHYTEAALVAGLGVTRDWLRRVVGGLKPAGGYGRVYLGAEVLARLVPCPTEAAPPPGRRTPTSRGALARGTGEGLSLVQQLRARRTPPVSGGRRRG